MSKHAELKKLAETAPEGPWFGPDYAPDTGYVFDNCLGSLLHYESIEYEQESCLRYVAAANPAAVLALIADNESLLEALEMAMEIGDQCSRGFLGKFQAKARAAIAKAKGESA